MVSMNTVNLFLAVIVFVLLGKVVNAIGKSTICDFCWEFYTQVGLSSKLKEIRALKRKAIDLHTRRSNTSSKDEFAKWAKLDREYSKIKTQIDSLNGELAKGKTAFQGLIKAGLFMVTFVPKIYLRVKYRKVPVFWLPDGILPYYGLWFLSLTSAPLGSVSVSIWLFIVEWAVSAFILVGTNGFKLVNQQSTMGENVKIKQKRPS